MKTKFVLSISTLFLFSILFATANSAFAGFLQFPCSQYTSSSVSVTAVMDHDSRWNYIKTYTGETGSYWDGCKAYVNRQNVDCEEWNEPYPWGYESHDNPTWSIPSMNYNDGVCEDPPTCTKYMWYDNHHGYDFAIPQWTGVGASAGGTVTNINSSFGQITIDHGNGYRTTYTHMYLLQPLQEPITKGQMIGWVSDVGAPGAVHLHFVVERYIGGSWYLVDPYGGSGEPVLWE